MVKKGVWHLMYWEKSLTLSSVIIVVVVCISLIFNTVRL